MIYGKFKYVLNSSNELTGINSLLDPLPVKNTNLCVEGDWAYVAIDGDISSYDLSLFSFEPVSQNVIFAIYQGFFPDSIILENGAFGHTDRMPRADVEVSLEEKMLDPAKWGIDYHILGV
jgi:hypothetical protein